jgi:tRNA threonylcarbamoyladenosine biosynthesis protein TsaB
MIVLGLDTATRASAVGLRLSDGSALQARDDPEGEQRPGHATRLLPLASQLLADAGIGWSEIERIAVGVGPGTFTGLRIGVATARGLAQSLGVSLVGVSSLAALAHTAARSAGMLAPAGVSTSAEVADRLTGTLALIDARRGEIFAAAYAGEVELLPAQVLAPSDLAELIERAGTSSTLRGLTAQGDGPVRGWTAVGDGAVRYREELEPGVLVPDEHSPLHRVDGRAICVLGECAITSDAPVVPDYRRRPDAEIALEGAAS